MRKAERRELQLRDDMEKLRNQQEQTLGTLDTKIDAMMERRTQAVMDRLDGLLGNMSGSKNGEKNSPEPSREPSVNFNEQPNRRRTYRSTRRRGSSSSYVTWDNMPRGPNIGVSSSGNRPTSNERRKQDMCDWEMWFHELESCESRNKSSQRFEQVVKPRDSTRGQWCWSGAFKGHDINGLSLWTSEQVLGNTPYEVIWNHWTQWKVQKGF